MVPPRSGYQNVFRTSRPSHIAVISAEKQDAVRNFLLRMKLCVIQRPFRQARPGRPGYAYLTHFCIRFYNFCCVSAVRYDTSEGCNILYYSTGRRICCYQERDKLAVRPFPFRDGDEAETTSSCQLFRYFVNASDYRCKDTPVGQTVPAWSTAGIAERVPSWQRGPKGPPRSGKNIDQLSLSRNGDVQGRRPPVLRRRYPTALYDLCSEELTYSAITGFSL